MPVQNKAIPDDNGIQQPSFVENARMPILYSAENDKSHAKKSQKDFTVWLFVIGQHLTVEQTGSQGW